MHKLHKENEISQAENKFPEVFLLMSTYNGELFLEEQLKSIFNQNGVQIRLIVRDDGSSDSTLEILEKYAEIYGDKLIILPPDEKNLGSANSFITLLNRALNKFPNAEIFAFADQDDYWLEDKIRRALEKIADKDEPALYFSKKTITDEKLEPLNQKDEFFYPDSFLQFVTISNAYGCTFVFNRALAELCRKKPNNKNIHHDAWIYRIAGSTGAYIYKDSDSYILYRQHSNNAVGKNDYWNAKKFLSRLHKKRNHILQKTYSAIYKQCSGKLIPEAEELITLIIDYRKNFGKRIKLMLWKEPRKYGLKTSLMWAVKVLLNGI